MFRPFLAALVGFTLATGPATAQNCIGSFPNTLTNGTNADATQVMANLTFLLNCINGLTGGGASTRQTATSGPVTTAGLPSFIPATTGTLSLTTTNIGASTPLAVSAANGADPASGAQKDLPGIATSNLSWPILAASTTNYLYVTIASNGALTTGTTTLAPIYQRGGTPATTAGQFTFNIGEMRGYLGNGTTALQAYVVFLGEAVTSASAVTSAIGYAYNGSYDSGFTATLPGVSTLTTANHNLGVVPGIRDFVIVCTTTDRGYAVGDAIGIGGFYVSSSGAVNPSLSATSNTMSLTTGSTQAFTILTKGTGATGAALTSANWKYKFVASRGW